MSTRIRFNAEKFTHDNYATSTTPATRTLPAACTALLVDNVDATISISVSFDAGATYKSIPAGSHLSVDVDGMLSYVVKSASGTPSVECLYASEA